METTFKKLTEFEQYKQLEFAKLISNEIDKEAAIEKMKKVTAEELIKRPLSVLAFVGTDLAGHASVKPSVLVDQFDCMEISGLWANQAFRGRGIAKALVEQATDFIHQNSATAYAYINNDSLNSFLANGFVAGIFPDYGGSPRPCVYHASGSLALAA